MEDPDRILLFPLWYAVFLLSLTCHEAAHAWVAYLGGDPTAYHAGQVSLNPLPHVRREPLGTVLIPVLTFMQLGWTMGWASAPYDPYWGDRHPRRAAIMALAGPAANLLLAGVAFAGLKAGLLAGSFTHAPAALWSTDRLVVPLPGADSLEGLGRLLSVLLVLNLALCLFNLLPVPPMDGASVLAGLVPAAATLRNRMLGSPLSGLLGLLVAWFVFPHLFSPVWMLVQEWLFGL